MKRIHPAIVIGLLLLPTVGGLVARAQDQTMQPRTPDEVVDTLATKLSLSDEQKTQIKPIIEDRQQQITALRSDTSSRPRQKMKKMKGIFQDSDKKIEAILNDQQKQQYIALEQQMREQARERMQSRRSGGESSPY